MVLPAASVVALQPEGMAEAVAREIKLGLYEGRYVPGQRMIETELAANLGVGRGSVREAMRALAAEGVIELELHRGARVRQFTRGEVLELSQVREALEGFAAGLAAQHGKGSKLLARLRAIQADAGRAMKAGHAARYLDLNSAFHETIFALSGNSQIEHHVKQAQIGYFRLQTRFFSEADLLRSHEEHAAIVAAILDGAAARADAAMRRHVRTSRGVILNAPSSFFRPAPLDAEGSVAS
jgi:DNA-binding GntR family transcriptional regulator